jgi:hypothetical protein
VLDECLDASHWEWAGSFITYKIPTSEPAFEGRFLIRWRNAHSSATHVGVGAFIIARSLVDATVDVSSLTVTAAGSDAVRAPLASLLLGVVMFILGFASYGWWGSRRYFCWRSDHSLMELHVLLLILNFYIIATGGAPDLGGEKNLVGTCCVIWLFRAYSMGKARLLYCCVLAYIAISQAMRKAGGNGSVALSWVGFPLSILSFVPKVLDVTGQWIWGTALFHVLVAIGFGLLWSWAQTLPEAV